MTREISEMNNAVLQRKIDRVVFKIYGRALLVLDQVHIPKIRFAVLVEVDPNFRTVDVGRVDANIAARPQRKVVEDGHLQMGISYEEKLFAGYLVGEGR